MPEPALRLREHGGGIDVPLHVQPRARSTGPAGLFNGALKFKVAAPPVDDAANRAIVEYFARLLDLPRARLSIRSGERSRDKVLRIEGISAARFLLEIPGPKAHRGE